MRYNWCIYIILFFIDQIGKTIENKRVFSHLINICLWVEQTKSHIINDCLYSASSMFAWIKLYIVCWTYSDSVFKCRHLAGHSMNFMEKLKSKSILFFSFNIFRIIKIENKMIFLVRNKIELITHFSFRLLLEIRERHKPRDIFNSIRVIIRHKMNDFVFLLKKHSHNYSSFFFRFK
jgi:hypothetical protein